MIDKLVDDTITLLSMCLSNKKIKTKLSLLDYYDKIINS